MGVSASAGHTEVVNLLLTHNANINQSMHDGTSPLYISAKSDHVEVVKTLLHQNANVNQRELRGGTDPLIVSTMQGHPAVVRILLEFDADINHGIDTTEAGKYTAMRIARQLRHQDIITILEEYEIN